MVSVAFVIDVFARKIVGWCVSTSMTTGFVLDALNQAIYQRAPSGDLVHYSDRGISSLSRVARYKPWAVVKRVERRRHWSVQGNSLSMRFGKVVYYYIYTSFRGLPFKLLCRTDI